MAQNLYTLGDLAFSPGGVNLDGLRRAREWRHNFTEAIRGRGARDYTGPGAETLSLSGVTFPGQYGDRDPGDQIAAIADTGLPQTLIDGEGYNLGQWVILSLEEEDAELLPGGRARRRSYSLQLRRDPNV